VEMRRMSCALLLAAEAMAIGMVNGSTERRRARLVSVVLGQAFEHPVAPRAKSMREVAKQKYRSSKNPFISSLLYTPPDVGYLYMPVGFSRDKNAPATALYSKNIPRRHGLASHSESMPALGSTDPSLVASPAD
jgi:hypothetical protein